MRILLGRVERGINDASIVRKSLLPSADHFAVCTEGFFRCLLSIGFIEPYDLHPLLHYRALLKIPQAIEHFL